MFDVTKPFWTRYGLTVVDFAPSNRYPDQTWAGHIIDNGQIRLAGWVRPSGKFRFDGEPHRYDLVNVVETPSEKLVITDEMVEAAAIQIWAMVDNIPVAASERLLRIGIDQKHSGDCTKESHSCMRCFRDEQLQLARRVLEAAMALQPKDN